MSVNIEDLELPQLAEVKKQLDDVRILSHGSGLTH